MKKSGHKKPGQSGQSASEESEMRSSSARSSAPYGSPSEPRGASARGYTNADRVLELMGTAVGIQAELQSDIGAAQMDIIYNKCKSAVYGEGYASGANLSRPASSAASSMSGYAPTTPTARASPKASPGGASNASQASSTRKGKLLVARQVKPEDLEAWTHEELRGGEVHPGRTFGYIVENDTKYAGFILERFRAGRIKDPSLVEFANYCELVQRQAESPALMAYDDGNHFHEDDLLAVIDTGCNNTCHGAQWLKKYMELLGIDIPLEPTDAME